MRKGDETESQNTNLSGGIHGAFGSIFANTGQNRARSGTKSGIIN